MGVPLTIAGWFMYFIHQWMITRSTPMTFFFSDTSPSSTWRFSMHRLRRMRGASGAMSIPLSCFLSRRWLGCLDRSKNVSPKMNQFLIINNIYICVVLSAVRIVEMMKHDLFFGSYFWVKPQIQMGESWRLQSILAAKNWNQTWGPRRPPNWSLFSGMIK